MIFNKLSDHVDSLVSDWEKSRKETLVVCNVLRAGLASGSRGCSDGQG